MSRPHADLKHISDRIVPREIRQRIRSETCYRLLAYFSSSRMTFLLLCKLPKTADSWGGWIFGAGTLVELTAYVAPWSYWQRVIERDGYFPALMR